MPSFSENILMETCASLSEECLQCYSNTVGKSQWHAKNYVPAKTNEFSCTIDYACTLKKVSILGR